MDTPYQYTGQKWEENDALEVYYYKARWYDPALRRFLQPDTIVPGAGNPQNLNRYSYAANSPIGNSDPTGHATFSDVGAYLLYNPVNNNVMVRDYGGSGVYALIAQASVGQCSAEKRLLEILWDTASLPWAIPPREWNQFVGYTIGTHFRGAASTKGDVGFAPEYRDDYLYRVWGSHRAQTSKQTGHLVTAIRMGYEGGIVQRQAVIGHEQLTDIFLPFQLVRPRIRDHFAFEAAVKWDDRGDGYARDDFLYSIFDPTRNGPISSRQGNSMEDLRLTVRGWRLGAMVAEGQIGTNKDLANWIALNVSGD